jgi:hypothetical protein
MGYFKIGLMLRRFQWYEGPIEVRKTMNNLSEDELNVLKEMMFEIG